MGPQKSQLDSKSEKIPGTNNNNQHKQKKTKKIIFLELQNSDLSEQC